METKKTNERKAFMGLVEMNEFQQKEVAGGFIEMPSIGDLIKPCCGLIILTDPTGIQLPTFW